MENKYKVPGSAVGFGLANTEGSQLPKLSNVEQTWLMSNIGGAREAKRRLVASVEHSKLFYALPVWDNALQNHAIQKRLFSVQRSAALRIVSAYRTVSKSAVLLLASVPPIDLLVEERQKTFQLCKELTCTDLQEIARAKEAIRKAGRHRLVEKWQMRWHGEHTGRWTYRLIPELATWLNRKHGEVGFYLAHALSGHGCFKAYLKRYKIRDEEMCYYCDSPVDNAEHALFVCAKWGTARDALGQAVGAELTPDTMVSLMLQSERFWTLIESFATCTRGLTSQVDLAVHVVRGRNLFILPLAGVVSRSS